MEQFNTLFQKSTMALLLSPPATGKTSLIIDIFKQKIQKVIYISPLRALAEEFYMRVKKCGEVYIVSSFSESRVKVKKFKNSKNALIIITPELMDSDLFWIIYIQSPLVVVDEFHLFFYWRSFRPVLWETCMGLANIDARVLALSATFSKELLLQFEHDFLLGMNNLYLMDFGNQKLKNYPIINKTFSNNGLGKRVLNKYLIFELFEKFNGTILYFCRYRSEVDIWLKFCKKNNINAIGCVGGESLEFSRQLKKRQDIKCIFSTIALSHGVNLPMINKIFISYNVENHDLYIQMVGRGGRKGEKFELYCTNQEKISNIFMKLYDYFKVFMLNIKITLLWEFRSYDY